MSKTIEVNNFTGQQSAKTTLDKIQSALCDVCLSTPGLAIGTSSKKAVKMATAFKALIDGALTAVASAEVALAGTVVNAKFNVFVLYATGTNTVASAMGTEAATLAAVVFPTIPADAAVIGFVIINPTGSGNFAGGSTDLDDGTVVPNAVYINTPYPFNPNMLSL